MPIKVVAISKNTLDKVEIEVGSEMKVGKIEIANGETVIRIGNMGRRIDTCIPRSIRSPKI